MNVFECMEQRESCRDYDPEKAVEREQLVRCIEAARMAPSACNSQPWHYLVVRNAEDATALRPMLQGMGMNAFVKNCPAFIVVTETPAGATASIGGKLRDQHYAPTDIGLSVSQLCLAATAQGLGTCILGWFDEKKIKEYFELPKNHRVRLVLCVGYAKKDTLRKKQRKSLEEISTFRD